VALRLDEQGLGPEQRDRERLEDVVGVGSPALDGDPDPVDPGDYVVDGRVADLDGR